MGEDITQHFDAWFTYHPATDEQVTRYTDIRGKARELAEVIAHCTPPGRDQTVAIRKLREAVMYANAAIACGE